MSFSQPQKSHPLVDSDIHVLQEWMMITAIGSLFFGFQVVLALTTISQFIIKGFSQSRTRMLLCILTVLNLITSMSDIIANTTFYIVEIPLFGFDPPVDQAYQTIAHVQIAVLFLDRINFILSDGIVVWRAWIMFPESSASRMTLLICMLGSFAGTLVDIGLAINNILHNDKTAQTSALNSLILMLPLLLTNSVATMLIAYKTWHHRQDIKKNLGSTSGPGKRIQKTLLLLVESGIIYFLLWTGYTIASVLPATASILAFGIYSSIMPSLSATYPLLVILIATHENSKPDSMDIMSLSQSIRFASLQPNNSEAGMISSPIATVDTSNEDPHNLEHDFNVGIQ